MTFLQAALDNANDTLALMLLPDLCKIRLLGILISNVRSEDRWKDRGTIDLRRVCAVGFGKRAYNGLRFIRAYRVQGAGLRV